MAGQYISTQTTKTFSYLYSGARRELEAAEQKVEGPFYKVLNCLILQAFTVEAYLNHLIEGPEKHGLELIFKTPRPNVWEKYKAIAKALQIKPIKLVDAYPHVAAILEFRNALAHGRTESISINKIVEAHEAPIKAPYDQFPNWMNFCEIENARKGLNNVRELIEEVHEKAGLGKSPLNSLGGGMSSFKLLP